jgi:hypothetical protein
LLPRFLHKRYLELYTWRCLYICTKEPLTTPNESTRKKLTAIFIRCLLARALMVPLGPLALLVALALALLVALALVLLLESGTAVRVTIA